MGDGGSLTKASLRERQCVGEVRVCSTMSHGLPYAWWCSRPHFSRMSHIPDAPASAANMQSHRVSRRTLGGWHRLWVLSAAVWGGGGEGTSVIRFVSAAMACAAFGVLLTTVGCTDTARLSATISALQAAADQCLYDVRDRHLTGKPRAIAHLLIPSQRHTLKLVGSGLNCRPTSGSVKQRLSARLGWLGPSR